MNEKKTFELEDDQLDVVAGGAKHPTNGWLRWYSCPNCGREIEYCGSATSSICQCGTEMEYHGSSINVFA